MEAISSEAEIIEKQESALTAAAAFDENMDEEKGDSKVFSRDLYAQRDFWNDRFREGKGHFDWYANWKQIKPVFNVSKQIWRNFYHSFVLNKFDIFVG